MGDILKPCGDGIPGGSGIPGVTVGGVLGGGVVFLVPQAAKMAAATPSSAKR